MKTAFVKQLEKMGDWLKEGSPQFSIKFLDWRKYITVVLLRRVIDDDKDLIYCIYPGFNEEEVKPFGYYFKGQNKFVCIFEESVIGFRFNEDMQKEAAYELPWFTIYSDAVSSFLKDWEEALKEYFGILHRDEVLAQQESSKKKDFTSILDEWYLKGKVLSTYENWLKNKTIHETSGYGEDENMDDNLLWMYISRGAAKETLLQYLDENGLLHRVKYTKMVGNLGKDIYIIRSAIGDYFELKKQFEAYKPSPYMETVKRAYDCVDRATSKQNMVLTAETDKGIYNILRWEFLSHARTGFNFRSAKLIKKKGKSRITAFDVADILRISLGDTVIYEK